jgi:hypothetical protein
MHPSGAKARFFPALDGMAKAMPLQSTIYEIRSRYFRSATRERHRCHEAFRGLTRSGRALYFH